VEVFDATSTFTAPCQVSLTSKRHPTTGQVNSLIMFWIVPTGVGRCRFIASSIIRKSVLPLGLGRVVSHFPPRWKLHLTILPFQDQDTYLLYTNQVPVLRAELAAHQAGTTVRRSSLFRYTSPGERMITVFGKFLDATAQSMPNRRRGLEAWLACIDAGGMRGRVAALDRWSRHTAICPDSRAAHRNITAMAWAAAAVAAAAAATLLVPMLLAPLLGPGSGGAGWPQVDPACVQLLKLKHDKLLSNFAVSTATCCLYTGVAAARRGLGGAVQVQVDLASTPDPD